MDVYKQERYEDMVHDVIAYFNNAISKYNIMIYEEAERRIYVQVFYKNDLFMCVRLIGSDGLTVYKLVNKEEKQ